MDIGSNNTVIETGLQNLTQDVASCLVHFGPYTTQTWLLVRLKRPEMPGAFQNATAVNTKEVIRGDALLISRQPKSHISMKTH